MRNDLIVFEFEGFDGREILLKPELVNRLAETLQTMFNQSRQVLASEDDLSSEMSKYGLQRSSEDALG